MSSCSANTRAIAWLLSALICWGVVGRDAFGVRPLIGQSTPKWKVDGVDGRQHVSTDKATATVIFFTCSDCPVASKYTGRFTELARSYSEKGVRFVAVNPTDTLAKMKRQMKGRKLPFVYGYDRNGVVARAFGAKVTPEVFLVGSDGRLAYRGALDNSQRRPTRHFVKNAIDSLLAGEPIEVSETKPFGCSIRVRRDGGKK